MTCCNNNCNQGRNCPASATDVARVGKQHPKIEPNFTLQDDGEQVEIPPLHVVLAFLVIGISAATIFFLLAMIFGK